MLDHYGSPVYDKHIQYWRSVRTDNILPSIIAFNIFISRMECIGRHEEAKDATEMMDIFKYLEYGKSSILPIYNQKKLVKKDLKRFRDQYYLQK